MPLPTLKTSTQPIQGVTRLAATVLFLLTLLTHLNAQQSKRYLPSNAGEMERTVRFDKLNLDGKGYLDSDGEIRFASGFRSASLGNNRSDSAKAFIRMAGQRFSQYDFEISGVAEVGGDAFVRLNRTVRGIPVHENEVVLGLDSSNSVFSISSRVPSSQPSSGDWSLSGGEALALAEAVGAYHLRAPASAQKAWFAVGQLLRPAWIVLLPADEPFGDWEVVVDAETGGVLRTSNLIRGATGYAFARNPVTDGAPTVTTLPTRTAVGLTNQYARVSSRYSGAELQSAMPDANGNFLYQPGHPFFSEVQLFTDMNRVHSRFAALGYKGLDRVVAGVVYYPDAVNRGPFYSPATNQPVGTIHFAPVAPSFLDLAWDADVIFHEYTHAVVNTFVGGSQGDWMQALNEAYADYFSGSFHNDPDLGAYAAAAFGAPTRYLRTLRNNSVFPYGISQDPHTTGLIWGGALWDVRTALGAERSDAIALASIGYLNGGSTMFDAAAAAIDASQRLYGKSASDAVSAAMARRGLTAGQTFQPFPLIPGTASAPRTVPGSVNSCILDAATFTVDVPRGTTRFSVGVQSTAGLPVETFIRFGRPPEISGNNVVSDYKFVGFSSQLDIGHQSTPELQTGVPSIADPGGSSARYYVRIGNCNGVPSAFSIYPTFSTATAAPKIKIVSGETVSGSVPPGPVLNSRQFQVDVGTADTQLALNLSATADVALYLRYGTAVQLGPQGRPVADAYVNSAGLSEALTLTTLTTPALRPGTWFIAIANNDSTKRAEVNLRATLSTAPVQDRVLTDLAVGASRSLQVPAGAGGFGRLSATQFRIQTSAQAPNLTIAAKADRNINGTVFIRRGTPVTVESSRAVSDYSFGIAPTGRLTIDASSEPPFQRGAIYYVAVANFGIEATTVTIDAGGTTSTGLSLSCDLANGPSTLNAQYSNNCTASGGNAPYTFSISTGSLPTNIRLASSGAVATITGAASVAGAYSYVLQVRDSSSPAQTATRAFAGTVTAVSVSRPVINAGGVVTVASSQQRLAPLGLISVYGRNFGTSTSGVSWNGSVLPTVLDGVSVSVDGRAAYILFVKNDFMNIVVPDSPARGAEVNVTVSNPAGTSDAVRVRIDAYAPEFKTWGNNYVEALHSDGTATTPPSYVAPTGMYPRSAPARPGESISIWALGFGPSNPLRVSGTIAPNTPLAAATPPLTVTIGGRSVRVDYAGLGGVGLYQFNVTIPSDLADGDYEILASMAGYSTQRGLRIPVRR